MKNQKDKQIRELNYWKRQERKSNWGWGVSFLGFIVFFIVFFINTNQIDNLEQQLQSCQEKVPVWTLNIECEDFDGIPRVVMDLKFDDYRDYKFFLNDLPERCEVISK